MPPKGRPTSSHSSRPTSHSSHASHSSHSHSSHSSGFHHSAPHYHHHSHYGGSSYGNSYHRSYSGGGRSLVGSCISILAIIALIVVIAVIVMLNKNKWGSNQNQNQHAISMQSESHDSIYVAALERDVPWNSEYDSYYDRQTDCYFFLNTEMDPPIWQYWYEGVSSEYGDYGWMEWDARESRWYIQTGENKWNPLPENKYRTYFWHFD